MAEIFISYKSERRKAAAHLAKILERYGYTVWFDYHLVKGDDFADEIDRRIREAKALVVLWCRLAVQSAWVRREAALATKLKILVPAKIEPCDLRVDFDSDDYTDLSDWNGAPLDRKLYPLLDGIAHRVGLQPQLDFRAMREYEEDWHRFGAPSLKAFALDAPVARQEAPLIRAMRIQSPVPSENGWLPAQVVPDAFVAISQAEQDWKVIENSNDPDDFRDFIDEYKSGLWVGKARRRLRNLADAAWATAQASRPALESFIRSYSDSEHAKTARAMLAELAAEEERQEAEEELQQQEALLFAAQHSKHQRRRKEEVRHRAECRIKVAAAFPEPRGLEWFLPGAGKTEWFKDLDIGPEMVVVPAGCFQMGSSPDEPERSNTEGPKHKVTIAKPFAIGRFAVTFDEWDAAQKDKDWQAITNRAARQPKDEGWGRGDRPVIDVDWEDAQAYAKWLSQKTDKDYRLPSEAEWEYACRAGTVTPFWWGSSITPEQANYDGYAVPYKGGGENGVSRQKTLPVKSFEPNPWGLYQVHGNVWEWCEDLWHDDYYGAPHDGSAWAPGSAESRCLRGGSGDFYPGALRAAHRDIVDIFWTGTRFLSLRIARTIAV